MPPPALPLRTSLTTCTVLLTLCVRAGLSRPGQCPIAPRVARAMASRYCPPLVAQLCLPGRVQRIRVAHVRLRTLLQVWDWRTLPSGADVYDVQLFVLHPADSTPAASGVAGEGSAAPEAGQGDAWHAQRHRAVYRALRRAELSLLLRRAGFGTVRWLLPAKSGFFQPVVVASVAADLPHQL